MKKRSTCPEIRVSGYEENWVNQKLISLCEKFSDGDWIEAKDQSESGIRLIQTGNIGVTEFIEKPNSKKSKERKKANNNGIS